MLIFLIRTYVFKQLNCISLHFQSLPLFSYHLSVILNSCSTYHGLRKYFCPSIRGIYIVDKSSNLLQYGLYFLLFFSVGPFLIIMCSLKLLRFAFSQTSKQYLIMTFTVFFFKYDYRDASETFLIDYFFISIVFVKVSIYTKQMLAGKFVCLFSSII